jgi:hypothetical protein
MLLLPYRPIVASLPPDNAAAYAPVDGNGQERPWLTVADRWCRVRYARR